MRGAYVELVLAVSAVVFFKEKTSWFKRERYFWKYRDDIVSHGPFTTLLDAGYHFEVFRTTPRPPRPIPPEPPPTNKMVLPDNVIQVDFTRKRQKRTS